jgi:type II secretory pathway predicted ATPase ExeA
MEVTNTRLRRGERADHAVCLVVVVAMYFLVSPYRDLLQGIETALTLHEGILKISGATGVGKSSLCQQLVKRLQANAKLVVFFATPPASPGGLQQILQQQLAIPAQHNFVRALTQYLQHSGTSSQVLHLVFDDAQHLDDLCLEHIRLLANIQDYSRSLVRVVLCGDETLNTRFQAANSRAFAQHLGPSFTLSPLNQEQLHDFYWQYWHERVDRTEKALQTLQQTSAGFPGAVLQALAAERLPFVEERAALPPVLEDIPRKPSLFRPMVVAASVAIAVLLYTVIDKSTTNSSTAPTASLPVIAAPPAAAVQIQTIESELPVPTSPPSITPSIVLAADISSTTTPVATAPVLIEPQAISEPEVTTALNSWIAAWQQQSLANYFAGYSEDYAGASRAAWEAERSRIIGKAKDISIHWYDLKILATNASEVRVELQLDYQAQGYADTTQKLLVLQRSSTGLKISAETNVQVTKR